MGSEIHSKAGSSQSLWLPVEVGMEEASCIVIEKHGLSLHPCQGCVLVAASWRSSTKMSPQQTEVRVSQLLTFVTITMEL
jgi:hypothetical protein